MLSRRALLFATAVLAAGCVGSAPGGRVRVAAGERGGLYLAFAELVAKQLKARYPDMAVEAVVSEIKKVSKKVYNAIAFYTLGVLVLLFFRFLKSLLETIRLLISFHVCR